MDTRVDDIKFGSLQRSKDLLHQKNSTAYLRPKQMAINFTKSINRCRLSRINQTWTTLKIMKLGYCTPKVDAWKIVKNWGIGTKTSKNPILDTTQNAFRDVTRPLTKRLRTREEMF